MVVCTFGKDKAGNGEFLENLLDGEGFNNIEIIQVIETKLISL